MKRFKWIGDTLKKAFSPNFEKALIFLDNKLLSTTSIAVERGNGCHRKMQKSVYRVRNQSCLEGRIALDMTREHELRAEIRPLRHCTGRVEDTLEPCDPGAVLQCPLLLRITDSIVMIDRALIRPLVTTGSG